MVYQKLSLWGEKSSQKEKKLPAVKKFLQQGEISDKTKKILQKEENSLFKKKILTVRKKFSP